jgi:HSP90 family molecular chaperone
VSYLPPLRGDADSRDPAEVKNQEYRDFYKGVSKDDSAETLGWAHFKVSYLAHVTVVELT